MNLAFKPEVAAAMYFAPSGPDQPYDRFDDIWMGIIAKKVFDHLNLRVSTGFPQIIHDRASDPFKNLIKEAPGIEANEGFWQDIDSLPITGQSIADCIEQVAAHMTLTPYRSEDYFRSYGQSLKAWLLLTQRREAGDKHEQLYPSDRKHPTQDDRLQESKKQPSGRFSTRGSN
jgi:hypothetical protein